MPCFGKMHDTQQCVLCKWYTHMLCVYVSWGVLKTCNFVMSSLRCVITSREPVEGASMSKNLKSFVRPSCARDHVAQTNVVMLVQLIHAFTSQGHIHAYSSQANSRQGYTHAYLQQKLGAYSRPRLHACIFQAQGGQKTTSNMLQAQLTMTECGGTQEMPPDSCACDCT
jgi:hypothetical protein